MNNEKVIKIHKYDDGNEAVIVEFGSGKVGIALGDESKRTLCVHLQELNERKEIGHFLSEKEIKDSFDANVNQLEVVLAFPDAKSIDNFIASLEIYRRRIFEPFKRTRS